MVSDETPCSSGCLSFNEGQDPAKLEGAEDVATPGTGCRSALALPAQQGGQ